MDKAIKIQKQIQNDVNKTLKSGDYSHIFEALKRVNKAEGDSNGKTKFI